MQEESAPPVSGVLTDYVSLSVQVLRHRLHRYRAVGAGYFHKLAGNPRVAGAGIRAIDNARFRDMLLKSMYRKAEGPLHKVL